MQCIICQKVDVLGLKGEPRRSILIRDHYVFSFWLVIYGTGCSTVLYILQHRFRLVETLRSRFGHLTANGSLRLVVSC